MCYSFQTSIISTTFGLLSFLFAFYTRQYVLGTLILFYVQIQVSEAIIWNGIDTNNESLNKFGTSYGKYLLASHNIGIGLGIILSILLVSKRKLNFKDFIPLCIGLSFFLFVVLYYYNPNDYPDTTYPYDKTCKESKCQNPNNRLNWTYPYAWYILSFIITIMIVIIWCKPLLSKLTIIMFYIITFVVAIFVYPKTTGSIWCFTSAILSPVIVILNYFLIKNVVGSNILI